MKRFASRKFLLAAAAFLGSIGTSIGGLVTASPQVATVGIICAIVSSAIYSACEAYVDGKAVGMSEDNS